MEKQSIAQRAETTRKCGVHGTQPSTASGTHRAVCAGKEVRGVRKKHRITLLQCGPAKTRSAYSLSKPWVLIVAPLLNNLEHDKTVNIIRL